MANAKNEGLKGVKMGMHLSPGLQPRAMMLLGHPDKMLWDMAHLPGKPGFRGSSYPGSFYRFPGNYKTHPITPASSKRRLNNNRSPGLQPWVLWDASHGITSAFSYYKFFNSSVSDIDNIFFLFISQKNRLYKPRNVIFWLK
ncbi:hypothetical protein [Chitinophaga varians]|uniref:hypothetical protein n=1 Tax=Chitinophaga varians TaxID=2202339 RepID=UPI00165FAF57|nr:hypothetical protein [Chitinophaga varians]MBC9912485.1 hypothetical protein [Chitinophaga varians]